MAPHQLSTAQRIAIKYYRTKLKLLHAISQEAAAKAALDIFIKPYANTKRKDTPLFSRARRFQFISENNQLTGYHFKGEQQSDKKLLILHGFAGSCRAFERYILPAIKKGYEVYTFDAPAHGLSMGKRLTVLMYRNAIMEMIRLYGPFDAYISHSLGGLSLILALEQMPDLPIAKTVLIAPATESITAADNFFSVLNLPKALRPPFEKHLEALANLPLQWYSISRALPSVKSDILWVHDEDDPTTPIKDVWPIVEKKPKNIQFHFTKTLGHSKIYKDATVKKIIVDFL